MRVKTSSVQVRISTTMGRLFNRELIILEFTGALVALRLADSPTSASPFDVIFVWKFDLPHDVGKRVGVSLAAKDMATRQAELFEDFAGVNSPLVDLFRFSWQCKVSGLLDDRASRFRSHLSASLQGHKAENDHGPCEGRRASPEFAHK